MHMKHIRRLRRTRARIRRERVRTYFCLFRRVVLVGGTNAWALYQRDEDCTECSVHQSWLESRIPHRRRRRRRCADDVQAKRSVAKIGRRILKYFDILLRARAFVACVYIG